MGLLEPDAYQHHSEVSYYATLPYAYNNATINFNATSRQMKGAVNQRVFDVPAGRNFLLTDFQEQLDEHFDIGSEMVCYSYREEIPDLIRYYLKNENARKEIAQKGYRRVLRDHTYPKRLQQMISHMRNRFS
jgi:spore maturation protein CgeB